jgi:calcineurin-like phosphoesterase family protein
LTTDPGPPYDLIGDVHGCRSELETLLADLGWDGVHHPEGRTAVFVGDLVDRGPDTPGVLRLVMAMADAGTGLSVQGNHEAKLVRALHGAGVRTSHGLQESLDQLHAQPAEFREQARAFMARLPHQLTLDGGRLLVAHAGLREDLHGSDSPRARSFALYGDTTGRSDEYGLPVRPRGSATTAARRRSSTATPPSSVPSGSTTPSASTPGSSSAAG